MGHCDGHRRVETAEADSILRTAIGDEQYEKIMSRKYVLFVDKEYDDTEHEYRERMKKELEYIISQADDAPQQTRIPYYKRWRYEVGPEE